MLNASQIVNNPIISSGHVHSWFSVVSNAVNPVQRTVGPDP